MDQSHLYVQAIEEENIPKLEELVNLKVPCYINFSCVAAKSGKISILQWIRNRCHVFSSSVMENAIIGNQLETVKWLIDTGLEPTDFCLSLAVEKNDITLVEILLKHGPDLEFDSEMVNQAAMRGHVDMLLLMSLQGADEHIHNCAEYAAAGNQLRILQILKSVGIKFTTSDMVVAAECGSLDCLKWFLTTCKMEYDPIIYRSAITANQQEVISWLKQGGYTPHDNKLVYSSTVIPEHKISLPEAQELMKYAEYACECYKHNFNIPDVVFCNCEKTDSESYIWSTDTEMYILFRGTEDPKDVLYDLDVRTTTMDPGVYVHNGFHTQFYSIEPLLTFHIEKYLRKGNKKLILIGHSLGGALASIACYHYSHIYHDLQIYTYTFGSPRVGNSNFAKHECHTYGCRVYNYEDPVPMLPFSHRFEHVHTTALCLTSTVPHYTSSDIPWYYRLLSFFRINSKDPIHAHYSATYCSILNTMCGH